MDWLALGVLVFGGIAGYATSSLRRERSPGFKAALAENEKRRQTEPRCLCEHWFNQHMPGGGQCQDSSVVITEPAGIDAYSRGGGLRKETRTNKCSCLGYLGPDPLISGLWCNDALRGEPEKR